MDTRMPSSKDNSMEWKKIIVQSLLTVILTVGTILIGIGYYKSTVEQHTQALISLGREHKEDVSYLSRRIELLEKAHVELSAGMSANASEHKAILRELDNVQKQLDNIQSTLNKK